MDCMQLFIEEQKEQKTLLVMSHCVLGFPSLEENMQCIDALVEANVDIIELQMPFSDPIADGVVLTEACHHALRGKVKLADLFALLKKASEKHRNTAFVVMTYFNPIYQFGLERAARFLSDCGAKSIIVPDLPSHLAVGFNVYLDKYDIQVMPMITSLDEKKRREDKLKSNKTMVYCVARAGVTGKETQWNGETADFLSAVRETSETAMGVGFGVTQLADIEWLKGKTDVAIMCTEFIRRYRDQGLQQAAGFMSSVTQLAHN
ncbi:MAG: tryptophan synthase alpha chain [Oceanicoccus sp.]|jgi:tryptophan synthase alpha chain